MPITLETKIKLNFLHVAIILFGLAKNTMVCAMCVNR